jgi:hypothetical protein
VNRAMELLQRWEEIDDPPGENRIAEARRDISYLVVELNLATQVIRKVAGAGPVPDHLWAAHEAACAYLAGNGGNGRGAQEKGISLINSGMVR